MINLLYFFQITICSTFTKLRPKSFMLSGECALYQATYSLKYKQLFNKNSIKKKPRKTSASSGTYCLPETDVRDYHFCFLYIKCSF